MGLAHEPRPPVRSCLRACVCVGGPCMPHACGFTATPFTLLPEVREFIRDAKHHDAKPSFSTTRPRLPRNLNPALLTPPRTICLSIYLCIFGSLLSAARGTPSSFLPVPPCSARRSPSQHVGRSPPASVGAPAPPRRPSTWSPATTSSPLPIPAASDRSQPRPRQRRGRGWRRGLGGSLPP